jgi:integrase
MLIDAYRARLVLSGARPSTVTAKLTCLRAFSTHAAPRGLEGANRFDVESYLARPLAPESRRAYRSTLRGFYSWAFEEGLIPVDPTDRLPAIRVPKGAPRPISDGDLASALASADPRMRSWLLLMSLGGLRCLEVSGLRPVDVTEVEGGHLLFLRECKGGGTAYQPCHPLILEALAVLPISNALWWSCSRVTISAQVSQYLRSVGVDATAHRLRHYAGTAWFRASGHDLLTTARLLRHANVATTQIYAQVDPTRPAEVVNLVRAPLQIPPVRPVTVY